MEQKSNKGLIWLTVLLIILFIGLISLVVFNTMLQKEKPNNDNTTTTTTTTEEKQNEDNKIIKNKKINNKGVKVELEYIVGTEESYLIINNKKIDLFNDEKDAIISFNEDFYHPWFNLYENFIEVVMPDPVNDNNFEIYDYNGNKLFDPQMVNIDSVNYSNSKWKNLTHYYFIDDDYKILDTKIEYNIRYFNDSCQFNIDNCEPVDTLSCYELTEIGEKVYDTRKYEIEFNGISFNEPKLVSSIKLKDSEQYKIAKENCN